MLTIETNRLILQPFSPEDAGEYFNIIDQDPLICEFVFGSLSNSFDGIQGLVNSYSSADFKTHFCFEIYETNVGRIIGSLIAVPFSDHQLDIQYLIGEPFRNQGYATEAVLAFLQLMYEGVEYIRYSHLRFQIDTRNTAAQTVVKKCGGKPVVRNGHDIIYKIKINHFDIL